MGKHYNEIPEKEMKWISEQAMFWVATAPNNPNGHVNLSPKGLRGTFKVINNKKFMYQDLSGSGAETVSHLRDNGRITIMFTAFDGPPNIVRLYGKGKCHERGSTEYDQLLPEEDRLPSSRAVIVVDVEKVGTSCGWGVPFYAFDKDRTLMNEVWSKREALDVEAPNGKAAQGLKKYWAAKNFESIDGLPAFEFARKLAHEESEAKGPNSQMVWGQGVFGGMKPHGDGKWVTQLVFIMGMIVGVAFSHFVAADRARQHAEL